jgi:hypothetical protein
MNELERFIQIWDGEAAKTAVRRSSHRSLISSP